MRVARELVCLALGRMPSWARTCVNGSAIRVGRQIARIEDESMIQAEI